MSRSEDLEVGIEQANRLILRGCQEASRRRQAKRRCSIILLLITAVILVVPWLGVPAWLFPAVLILSVVAGGFCVVRGRTAGLAEVEFRHTIGEAIRVREEFESELREEQGF